MKENRWLYVGGIAVLAALVVGGLIWSGVGRSGEGDGGTDGGDAATRGDGGDAAVAEAEGGAGGEAGVDDIGDVPTDPAECRAYCGRLAERRVLKRGTTAETCVEQLCSSEGATPPAAAGGGDAEPPERISTISDAGGGAPSSDCAAECRRLHAAGELRSGMTVDACVAAMCADEEAE